MQQISFSTGIILWVFTTLIFSCSEKAGPDKDIDKDSTSFSLGKEIPETRDSVKTEPVAFFRERTENPLNEWYFSVKLYETKKTFHYLIKLQFEEIIGTDTLRLPNFAITPKPVILKGNEKYSCIIGFLDKDGKFREYKKVYVKNNSLKITALRHYAVTTRERKIKN